MNNKGDDEVDGNVEQYSGDEALYCHLGIHAYTNNTCQWCQRRNTTVEYKPVTD